VVNKAGRLCQNEQSLASIHILDAVALVLERTRRVECLPAVVLALVLVRRRTYLRNRRTGTQSSAERGVVNDVIGIDYWFTSTTGVAGDRWARRTTHQLLVAFRLPPK